MEVFKNKKTANRKLRFWLDEFTLCESKTSLGNPKKVCFGHGIKKCNGACLGNESSQVYNKRILKIEKSLRYPHKNMLIIDKGKTKGEKSFIYIKNTLFQGYGYFNLNHQIKTIDAIEKRLIPIKNNRDSQALIRGFIGRNRYKKIIDLDAF